MEEYAARRAVLIPTASRGLEAADTFAERHKMAFVNLGVDEAFATEQAEKYYVSEDFVAGAWDPDRRIADLEAEGIVGEVIHPDGVFGTIAPFFMSTDPALRVAGARAYNRWLADLCAAHPGRRAGIAQIPVYDLDTAVAEIRWAHDAGLTGGISLPALQPELGIPGYNDPVYEPIWNVCAELAMPLNDHGPGFSSAAKLFGPDPFQAAALNTFEINVQRRTFWYLLAGGVFDRHPDLKLVFVEMGADWVPAFLREIDSWMDQFWISGLRQRLSLTATEYWARQCYVGSFLSRLETEERDVIGLETMLWGADEDVPNPVEVQRWSLLHQAAA